MASLLHVGLGNAAAATALALAAWLACRALRGRRPAVAHALWLLVLLKLLTPPLWTLRVPWFGPARSEVASSVSLRETARPAEPTTSDADEFDVSYDESISPGGAAEETTERAVAGIGSTSEQLERAVAAPAHWRARAPDWLHEMKHFAVRRGRVGRLRSLAGYCQRLFWRSK